MAGKKKKTTTTDAPDVPRVHKHHLDGSDSSRDFDIPGHSTGSANSEMDELSKQVTRDARGDSGVDSGGGASRENVVKDDES